MVLAYLLCVLGSSGDPPNSVPIVRVDVLEVNTCYDDARQPCYRQIIIWEWLPYLSQHGVCGWTMFDKAELQLVKVESSKRQWHFQMVREDKRIRVIASAYRETPTHVSQDPERRNQSIWPAKMRRGWK